MNTEEPRGRFSEEESAGTTSVLPESRQVWNRYGPTFTPPPSQGQYIGSEFAAPPPGRGVWTRRQKAAVGLALVAMALGGGAAGALVANAFRDDPVPAASSQVFGNPASVADSTTSAQVAKAVQPSVVSIAVRTQTGGAEGSGVVLSADGRILTNNHVVEGAGQGAQISVRFSDGKSASATVVGTDPATDIAVIQAQNVSGLTPASLGDSDKLQVGDQVLAIGSPLGLEGSVTFGIVSALDRTLNEGPEQRQPPGFPGFGGFGEQQQQSAGTTISGAIQTDAAINPGNSGGALVNTSGQVIGINTAIATNGGEGNIGVGFAIPINTAKQVSEQLSSSGKAIHAYLGVSVTDAMGGTQGALVGLVQSGAPADKAGLKVGDVITKINGKPVAGADTVVGMVRGFKPGDKVTRTFIRDGKTQTATVTLAEKTG
jgi:putative serine protease PepD